MMTSILPGLAVTEARIAAHARPVERAAFETEDFVHGRRRYAEARWPTSRFRTRTSQRQRSAIPRAREGCEPRATAA